MRSSTGFAGLPVCRDLAALQADVAIIGVPYATPYDAGKAGQWAGAPAALRAAISADAARLDHYDFDLGGPLLGDGRARVVDCGDVAGDAADAEGNRQRITAAIRAILEAGAVPIVIGGEHSVPIPVFAAFEGRGPLSVVHVDAHIDWRDEVGGNRHGLSSPMRRASEMPWIEGMVQVGMRGVGNARSGEVADARAWGSHLITAREVAERGIGVALERLPEGADCLVSIDCDGLDPAVMPAVMSPAPGGLTYQNLIDLIHGIAAKGRIAGLDLVEFAPARDPSGLAALTAARIICNVIGALVRA